MRILVTLYFLFISLLSFAQQTFIPVSATISDEESSYASDNFDAPNLQFWDNKSSITIIWGGDRLVLQRQGDNGSTYRTKVHANNISLTFSAYRSASSGKIYLITAKQQMKEGSVTIDFREKKFTYK